MTEAMKNRLELFAENRQMIKEAFPWQNAMLYPICAKMYADKGLVVDTEKIKSCITLMKENTGALSGFRGIAKLSVATMLSLQDDPERALLDAKYVYELLRKEFRFSNFLVFSAILIAQGTEKTEYEKKAQQTRAVYEEMKRNHRFLTSDEDSVFAALFALNDRRDSDELEEMEQCYRQLKPEFFSANAVQALSHVLALCEGNPGEKCDKTLALFKMFEESGHRYGAGYELPTIGVLALAAPDLEQALRDTLAADAFLTEQKGFGNLAMGKKTRLMYAAGIAAGLYTQNNLMNHVALNSMTALILAQEAAMLACIAASTAAAANASS